MICYQKKFNLPTEVVTGEQFWALVRAPRTARLVKEAREALSKDDAATYDRKKKQLPLAVFIGTFDESEYVPKDGTPIKGHWRKQSACRLNGLCVIDFDHLEGDVRKIWEEAYAKLSDEDKARILLVYVTPSGHGLKVVFIADPEVGNLIDNQLDFSQKLGNASLTPDESGKDASRGAFITTEEDIILIDEKLFTYENKAFGEKYDEEQ